MGSDGNMIVFDKNNEQYYPQIRNGRVTNICENPVEWFHLFDNNKPDNNFKNVALYGIQNSSILSLTFFSKENIQLLQDKIRYNVYIKSDKKYIIGEQSTIELEIIMRSVFLQNARHLPYKIKEQIKELDDIVVNQVTPRILSETLQYVGYLHRVETLPIPIELPTNMSSRGTKMLRSVTTTF